MTQVRRRVSLPGGLCLSFLVFISSVPALAERDAGQFLVSLSQQAIAELSDQSIAEAERYKRFQALLNRSFDMTAIAHFVLGHYVRSASPEVRRDFLAVFEEVLAQRFLPYFRDYQGEAFTVNEVKDDISNPEYKIVTSRIRTPSNKVFPVAWRLRPSDNSFKILDVVAEGVSFAITFRSEYTTVLKRSNGDVPALTQLLREKLKIGAFAPKAE